MAPEDEDEHKLDVSPSQGLLPARDKSGDRSQQHVSILLKCATSSGTKLTFLLEMEEGR